MDKHRERGLMRVGVIALIAIVLLGFGGMAIQQSAWSQGYMTGLMAGGDGDALAQYVLYNSRSTGPGFGFFWPLIFGFFLFMAAGKFMRRRAWRMAGGPGNTDWHQQWQQGGPPWRRPCAGTESQSASPAADEVPIPPVSATDDDRPA